MEIPGSSATGMGGFLLILGSDGGEAASLG
jgi:hypothetical protein